MSGPVLRTPAAGPVELRASSWFDGERLRTEPARVLIADGVIVAVGADVEDHPARRGARRIDGPGLLMPGFHDAHTHALGAGVLASEPALPEDADAAQILARLADHARRRPTGLLRGHGWSAARPAARLSASELEAVAPGRVVFLLSQDGHAALFSHAALAAAGVDAGTPDPEGGRFARDADGRPTGLAFDKAIERVRRALPVPDLATLVEAATFSLRELARHGITSVQDDPSYEPRIEAFRAWRGALEGGAGCRVDVWRRLDERLAERLAAEPPCPDSEAAGLVRGGLAKIFADGSLSAGTAWMLEPLPEALGGGTGLPLITEARLRERILSATSCGLQVGVHGIGDGAGRAAARAFEALPRSRRPRLEHAQHLRAEDLTRLARSGAVASVQPVHLAGDEARIAHLPAARRADSFRLRSLLDAGLILAFGSDWPVAPLDPRAGLAQAIRRDGERAPEGLSLAEALTAYTLGGARAAFSESWRGRVATGYAADLCRLDPSPFEAGPEAARVTLTMVAGRISYEA